MQFVRLVNKGDTPYDFHMQQRKRVIEPGQDAMVPWDVACSLFGDPFVMDSPTDMARQRAWKQSATAHNWHEGAKPNEYGPEFNQTWDDIKPKVEVYDVETGNRVYMVLEDPDGSQTLGNVEDNDTINSNVLMGLIRQQQEQIANLTLLITTGGQVVQGQQVVTSQDAGPVNEQGTPVNPPEGEPDPSLAFGGPILPVMRQDGPPPQTGSTPAPVVTPAHTVTIPSVVETPKVSVGGAAPVHHDPDALAELAPLDPTLTTQAPVQEAGEDTPQTPPVGNSTKLAPKPE